VGDVLDGSGAVVFLDRTTVLEQVERRVTVDLISSAEGFVLLAIDFGDLDLFVLVEMTSDESVSRGQLCAPTALGNVELHQRVVLPETMEEVGVIEFFHRISRR